MKRFRFILLTATLLIALVGGMLPRPMPVLAQDGVGVSINTPTHVAPGSDFTATVDISNVSGFDAANFDVSYDPDVLEIADSTPGVGITNGMINGTPIPVDMTNVIQEGTGAGDPRVIRVLANVPGFPGITGSGYLAELHFHVTGSAGDSSNIGLVNGALSNYEAQEIPATWAGGSVSVQTAQNWTVSGMVTDGVDPLEGVDVFLVDTGTSEVHGSTGGPTGVNGLYSITAPEGTYDLCAEKAGYVCHKEQINLTTDMPDKAVVD